jgi:hypothetical protein
VNDAREAAGPQTATMPAPLRLGAPPTPKAVGEGGEVKSRKCVSGTREAAGPQVRVTAAASGRSGGPDISPGVTG